MRYNKVSEKIDREIARELEKVKKVIVNELNPISIVLFGGVGKGEASICKGRLFNDLDIYVVTKKKISEKRLEEVGVKASKAINRGGGEFIEHSDEPYDAEKFFHVDLRCLKYSELGRLRKTTRAFEIKHSSQIMYGEDIRSLIKIKKQELPLAEGIRHLFNKSCFLLMTMDSKKLKGSFEKNEREYAIYHSVKTFLGCAEALLLAKGDDSPTYTGRNELFRRYYSKDFPYWVKKVDFATKFKMNLEFDKIKNVFEFWKQARNFLDFTLKYIAKNNLKINFRNRKELVKKLYKKLPYVYFNSYIPLGNITFPSQYILNLLYFRRSGYFRALFSWRDVGIRIFFPAYLLLFALEDSSLTKEAEKYLKGVIEIKEHSWEGLRKGVLKAYGLYYSQKLI